jgi:hypothetical protein
VLPRAAWLVAPAALTALATVWAAAEAALGWTIPTAVEASTACRGCQETWTWPEPMALPACLVLLPWALRLEHH